MKPHAELSKHILTQFVEDEHILRIVRHHHKHHRGSGYPGGLNGEQISIGARILAVQQMHDDPTGRPSAMNARRGLPMMR
jgi:response regulator RpfG family c-di-GMP phosphodiesterase